MEGVFTDLDIAETDLVNRVVVQVFEGESFKREKRTDAKALMVIGTLMPI
jgi:hypothetical protein